MGSPDFAVPTFKMLYQVYGDKLRGVFTRADAPKGRSKQLVPTPIKQLAIEWGVSVFTPTTKESLLDQVRLLNPDIIIIIAYGLILPKALTDAYFCMNLHGSLLPKYRGASPVEACLLNNDMETGITLMHINEYMDQGNILDQAICPIDSDDNGGTLKEKLSELSAQLLKSYLSDYQHMRQVIEQPQDASQASYCRKINREDALITDKMAPIEALARIRAFAPEPGAYVIHNQKRYKILKATIQNNMLQIQQIQPEGKKPMRYADFLLGNPQGIGR